MTIPADLLPPLLLTAFGLGFGTCLAVGAIGDWFDMRRQRRNVTFVRGKAEGPTKFPDKFAEAVRKLYEDEARRMRP